MPLSKRMMAVGMPALSAQATNGSLRIYASVSTTVSQAAATALTDDINIIPNAQAAGAVILPSDAIISDTVTISNFCGNNVTVYPPVGDKLNGGSTNAGVVLSTGSTVQWTFSGDGVNWYIT
jgi:hypothetical protein